MPTRCETVPRFEEQPRFRRLSACRYALPLIVACTVLAYWGQAAGAQPAPNSQPQAQPGTTPEPSRIAYKTSIEIDGPAALAALVRSFSRLLQEQGKGAPAPGVLEARLKTDLATFERILRSEGYYASRVSHRAARGRAGYDILIRIDPGPQYTVADIQIELNGAPANDETSAAIQPKLGIKAGDPARSEAIVEAERMAARQLTELGYPFAEILARDVLVDHAARSVAVTYAYATGPRVLMGEPAYTGLRTVDTEYLKRFQTWRPGEVYAQDKVDQFRRRLARLGLFRTIDMAPQRPDPAGLSDDQLSSINVEVEEREHRSISFGGGFSTSEGFGGEVSWEHRNLFGRQERLKIDAVGAEIEQSLGAEFAKPNFRRLDQTLNVNALLERNNTDAFRELAGEAGIGLERTLARHLSGGIGVDGKFTSIAEDGVRRQFVLFRLPVALKWDNSDDLFDPKRGVRAYAVARPSRVLLDDSFSFTSFEARASTYWAPMKSQSLVLALRGRLGAMLGPAADRIPASERYFAGGGGSIRGFGYQDVGPTDAAGDPVGGRSVTEFALETRLRISRSIGIVPFIEGGNVYLEKTPQFSGFRWGAGLGLRYFTSIVPIRVDIATPLDRRTGERSVQIYFSLGQSF